jgi:hypothetical protein
MQALQRNQPNPTGTDVIDHAELTPILEKLRQDGVDALVALRGEIRAYCDALATLDPDALSRDEALAFWLNLYNAGALDIAAQAAEQSVSSVLRLPGAFDRPWVTVAGEELSLDAIEHGKVRRFQDPRVHGALVCGSASCPTLRYEPYRGADLDRQLDHQMRSFLAGGGAVADRSGGTLHLSRIFLWFGGDFTRSHRMPTWLPPRKSRLVASLRQWLGDEVTGWIDESVPQVSFQSYDWSLACSIG